MGSPRKQTESRATKTGATEMRTVASPTGMCWKAYVPEK